MDKWRGCEKNFLKSISIFLVKNTKLMCIGISRKASTFFWKSNGISRKHLTFSIIDIVMYVGVNCDPLTDTHGIFMHDNLKKTVLGVFVIDVVVKRDPLHL